MAAKLFLVKGDTVMIRRGKEKSKRGVVKAIFPAVDAAIVEGLNIVKRHTKQGQKGGNMGSAQTGGIIEKEAPMPLSVMQYVCEKCKTPTRLGRARTADGRSHRVCVKCGEPARDSAKGA